MARDDRLSDKGKVRVRVIDFEMEGSNQTLRESIRDMVTAIGGASGSVRIVRPAALPPGSATAGGADSAPSDREDDVLFEKTDDSEPRSSDDISRPRTRKLKAPKILSIENFDSAAKSLKALMDEAEPDSELLKYLVAAFWYKHYGGITEVTADHIHTAFRHLGWHAADDVSKPLRSMKQRPYNYVDAGSARATFVVNHIGDKKVDELIKKRQG